MIKRDQLKPTEKPGIRYSGENAEVINIQLIRDILEYKNVEKFGLPIEITIDQVKSGGLFNSTEEDCVIITNKDHPSDYFKYCLLLQRQGKMAFLSIFYYGISTLTGKACKSEARKGSVGGLLINAFSGVNQAAYDAEYQYYNLLDALIDENLG